MMVQSRAKAAFRYWGFSCHPQEITRVLGLHPTKSWILGEPITSTVLKRQSNGWEIASRLPENKELSDHVDDLIKQLAPIKQKFKHLNYGGSFLVSCILYVSFDERPPIHVSSSSISSIAEFGAGIDVDMYCI